MTSTVVVNCESCLVTNVRQWKIQKAPIIVVFIFICIIINYRQRNDTVNLIYVNLVLYNQLIYPYLDVNMKKIL
mgnify:CR=1 FL=1